MLKLRNEGKITSFSYLLRSVTVIHWSHILTPICTLVFRMYDFMERTIQTIFCRLSTSRSRALCIASRMLGFTLNFNSQNDIIVCDTQIFFQRSTAGHGLLPALPGRYSRFQVTGIIEWSQKSRPKNP